VAAQRVGQKPPPPPAAAAPSSSSRPSSREYNAKPTFLFMFFPISPVINLPENPSPGGPSLRRMVDGIVEAIGGKVQQRLPNDDVHQMGKLKVFDPSNPINADAVRIISV
jgi:hypothetical protein